MKLHLKEDVRDMVDDLLIIEDQYKKTESKQNKYQHNGKQLKNPCRVHNGTHEWDECRKNPKNQRNSKDDKDKEQRNTEDRDACQQCRARAADAAGDSDEYESNCLTTHNDKKTPSSEILVAIPRKKGSKKYKTYLGFIDTRSSSSLLNKTIVENTSFLIKLTTKKILWDTQAGSLKTKSTVMLENYFLPQFTAQRKVTNEFLFFNKVKEDSYDVIIGRDILKTM
jgi:hypothetical protein